MAVRNIVQSSDDGEFLRKKSRTVTDIRSQRIQTLIDDMLETVVAANGAGLAAPQVAVLKRVVVVDFGVGDHRALINPIITGCDGEQISREGCLSVCGRAFELKRPMEVTVSAYDRSGNEIVVNGTGNIACRLCHEIDHLDGIIIEDKGTELFDDED